ncbi:MAG: hypothetical protein ABL967_03045 [Bryobacteraceae bacterium]
MVYCRLRRLFGVFAFSSALCCAQEPAPQTTNPPREQAGENRVGDTAATEEAGKSNPQATVTPGATDREEAAPARAAGQNVLGQADTARGEGRRNENVQINLVDNNAARDANTRVGATATVIEDFRADRSYFGGEYGSAGRGPIHAAPQFGSGVHGNLFWNHNNSVFSARTFFQVGSVQPARQNQYGAVVTTPLWKNAFFTFTGSQDKNRGIVNGNVLIPLENERTPLATDPVVRAMVQKFLDAYPIAAPNRPDIAANALNANSPQTVNTDLANAQFNQRIDARNALAARYTFTAQAVDPFQFVKGQNPVTRNKSHAARLTWNKTWSPSTVGDFTIGFDRTGVLLTPSSDAVGPVFVTGFSYIGPNNNIPIDRAVNQFREAASIQTRRGSHTFLYGGSLSRVQNNADEPDGRLQVWSIRDDFGNNAMTNLRLGRATQLSKAVGDAYRGFRNFEIQAYAGDRWTVNNKLTLTTALRWEPVTKPSEITNRNGIPYPSDWNNFGGSFGFAYRLPVGVVRSAFGLMYGQIFPVTYGQDRMNPPYYSRITIQTPDMANPLAGLTPEELSPAKARGMRFDLSPDLVTPYSMQYNFSWENEVLPGWKLQLGYVGSRSTKLFQTYVFNRGRVAPGVALTSATVNLRRPNAANTDVFYTGSFSRAYYDAGRASLTLPRWHGMTLATSYWFSKSMDLGADYVATGAGNERFASTSPTENGVHDEMRGLSSFDQPHALLVQGAYDTGRHNGLLGSLFRNWNIAGVYLLKNGTPFTVVSGSDGPGLGNVDGSSGDRPMVLDPSVLGRTVGNPSTSQRLLPKSAFRMIQAPAELSGNLGKNTFRKGKIANLNVSVARTWTIPRDWQLTLRAESINLTNTPQFAEPGLNYASPNFAQITNTLNDGRTFRFLLRVAF